MNDVEGDAFAEKINLKSYKYYDRILPNQDYVDDNGLGNLFALPLQGQTIKMGNSVFVDEEWNAYDDQIKILLTKTKLSKEFVEEKIKEWNLNNNFGFENDKNGLEPWKPISIHKSDINGILSIVLSNGIYIDIINISPKFQNTITYNTPLILIFIFWVAYFHINIKRMHCRAF